jgi:hypothetical protein
MRTSARTGILALLFTCWLTFISSAVAQGTIVRATYGAGHNRIDVTPRVQSLVQNGRLNFRLTNESLGVPDPAPGRVKELSIQMRQPNGQTRSYQFQEKGIVSLRVGGGFAQPRLSASDQGRFDSYYSRWLDYRRTNNRGEMVSMERRMRDIYANYRIPPGTPFDRVASPQFRPR